MLHRWLLLRWLLLRCLLLGWLLLRWPLLDGCFLDGCSLGGYLLWASQKMLVIFYTLGVSKIKQTTKLRCLSIFRGFCYLVSPALHPGFPDPWRSQPALSSTPTQGYFFFFECLGIQFLIHSNVTYRTPCHARGHSHSYLRKRRISLGVRGILSMCFRSHT